MRLSGEWRFDPDEYGAALQAAGRRIRRDRRRMSVDDARDIVRTELARHGQQMSAASLEQFALTWHRGPWWIWLHPRQARDEGWRVAWRRDT